MGTKEFLHLEEAASARVKKPETVGASLKTVKQTSSQLRHWDVTLGKPLTAGVLAR